MSKIVIERKLLEQALEALDLIGMTGWVERKEAARDALRAALEQPQVEQGPRPDEPMSLKEALREFARAIEAAHGIGEKR